MWSIAEHISPWAGCCIVHPQRLHYRTCHHYTSQQWYNAEVETVASHVGLILSQGLDYRLSYRMKRTCLQPHKQLGQYAQLSVITRCGSSSWHMQYRAHKQTTEVKHKVLGLVSPGHDSLSIWPDIQKNLLDLWFKSHVQHTISFIQDLHENRSVW